MTPSFTRILPHRRNPCALAIGDRVRWIVAPASIDCVDLRQYAGKVGEIVPKPSNQVNEGKPDVRAVRFPHLYDPKRTFTIINIHVSELKKAKA